MDIRYYGWIGGNGYNSMVKIQKEDGIWKAYVFNRPEKAFRPDDYYLKAMWDPGSEFEEISEDEAMSLIEGWSA